VATESSRKANNGCVPLELRREDVHIRIADVGVEMGQDMTIRRCSRVVCFIYDDDFQIFWVVLCKSLFSKEGLVSSNCAKLPSEQFHRRCQ
jgi:hypothetical protein